MTTTRTTRGQQNILQAIKHSTSNTIQTRSLPKEQARQVSDDAQGWIDAVNVSRGNGLAKHRLFSSPVNTSPCSWPKLLLSLIEILRQCLSQALTHIVKRSFTLHQAGRLRTLGRIPPHVPPFVFRLLGELTHIVQNHACDHRLGRMIKPYVEVPKYLPSYFEQRDRSLHWCSLTFSKGRLGERRRSLPGTGPDFGSEGWEWGWGLSESEVDREGSNGGGEVGEGGEALEGL